MASQVAGKSHCPQPQHRATRLTRCTTLPLPLLQRAAPYGSKSRGRGGGSRFGGRDFRRDGGGGGGGGG